MCGVRERETWQAADGRLGVVQRLLFRDPERGAGDRAREPVDFDAMEVADADFDRVDVVAEVEGELSVLVQIGEDPVLDATQFQIGFGQEVAGTAGWVEEPEAGYLVMHLLSALVREPPATGLASAPRVRLSNRRGTTGR